MQSRTLSKLRLECLLALAKEISIEINGLDSATTPAMFWQVAFRSEHASRIVRYAKSCGFNPTIFEMGEPNLESGNAWFCLISTKQYELISQLMSDKILPCNSALAEQVSGISCWHLLARDDAGVSLLNNKFANFRVDISNDLNAVAADTNMSVWYDLARNHHTVNYFDRLLHANIYPSDSALNAIEPNSNTSIWFKLVDLYHHEPNGQCSYPNYNTSAIEVIGKLFEHNLYPDLPALRAVSKENNTSCWYEFAKLQTESLIRAPFDQILLTLYDKGICISADELNALNGINNPINIWTLLLEHSRRNATSKTINRLFQDEIYPSAALLSVNAWGQLFRYCSYQFHDNATTIIKKLLVKGITPSKEMLSQIIDEDGRTMWHYIFCGPNTIFKTLLTFGIYPTEDDMNALNKESLSAWHSLVINNQSEMILELIKIGIFPSEAVMNTTGMRNNQIFGTVWELLRRNPEVNPALIFPKLSEQNILPLRACYVDSSDSVWWDTTEIFLRTTKINKLESHIKNVKKHNFVALVLSRSDADKYYGFLCFLYMIAEKMYSYNGFPYYDIIVMLAKQTLPGFPHLTKAEIYSTESREIFMRYHAESALTSYLGGSFFSKKHDKRAQSLLNAVKQTQDLRTLVVNQNGMMLVHGKSPYPKHNSRSKHEEPYSKPKGDDNDLEFKKVMSELFRVARKK